MQRNRFYWEINFTLLNIFILFVGYKELNERKITNERLIDGNRFVLIQIHIFSVFAL